MKELVIATKNKGKIEEFRAMLEKRNTGQVTVGLSEFARC